MEPKGTTGNHKPLKTARNHRREPKGTSENFRVPEITDPNRGNTIQRETNVTSGDHMELKGTTGNHKVPEGAKMFQREPKGSRGSHKVPGRTTRFQREPGGTNK